MSSRPTCTRPPPSWEVLAEGQIGPHGGLNFDAKPRRTSFAAGLFPFPSPAWMPSQASLVAAKMRGQGHRTCRPSATAPSIPASAQPSRTAPPPWLPSKGTLWIFPQSKLIEATKSDHLESVKATINNYMIDAWPGAWRNRQWLAERSGNCRDRMDAMGVSVWGSDLSLD